MGIGAVVFDMDGLMVNSEPVWHVVTAEVFAKVGIQLEMPDLLATTGLRLQDTVARHLSKFTPKETVTPEELMKGIKDGMVAKMRAEASPMPGLLSALNFFKSKNVPMAVASSSPVELIDATLECLKITSYFDHKISALDEEYGKPHPGVYIKAAKLCGVSPLECLALEDSVTGCLAAKSARFKCISVPDTFLNADKSKYAFTDAVLESLDQVNEQLWQDLR